MIPFQTQRRVPGMNSTSLLMQRHLMRGHVRLRGPDLLSYGVQ